MQVESQSTIVHQSSYPHAIPTPSVQKLPRKNDEIASLLANASLLLRANDLENAYILCVRTLQRDSFNLTGLNLMFQTCSRLQRYGEAYKIAQEILRLDYGFQSVYQVAQSFYVLGEDQKALDLFLEALSVLSEDSALLFEIYKSIGNIYVRFQDFDAAQEYYDKAYTLRPESDVLYVNYGTLEVQRGEYERALQCFRESVRLNSRNSKAWVGMAMIHDLRADFELAWANVVQAFDFDPKNKTSLLLIYQWAKRDRREKDAIPYLLTYLIDHEEDEEVSLWLTHLYLSTGEKELAGLEVGKILLFNSDHAEAKEMSMILRSQTELRFV